MGLVVLARARLILLQLLMGLVLLVGLVLEGLVLGLVGLVLGLEGLVLVLEGLLLVGLVLVGLVLGLLLAVVLWLLVFLLLLLAGVMVPWLILHQTCFLTQLILAIYPKLSKVLCMMWLLFAIPVSSQILFH